MTALNISKGGQISLPSDIRRRWGVRAVLLEDRGDVVLLRPMPADPIAHARGALAPLRISVDEARAQERADEAERDRERFGDGPE